MQKVMSTRIDESVLVLINRIAQEKKLSKKAIIEQAIRNFWKSLSQEKEPDFFQESFGAWKRDETPEETVSKARNAFNQGMNRHFLGEK